MNKVVLFGSTGLLGQAIYDRFSDFEGIQLFNPLRDEVDVTDFDSLSSYLKQVSPSHVINATGYNAVDMCEENPEPGFLLNSKVPEQIAKLSDVLDFIFIQFSSDYVFDGENPDGYREDAECNPINAYGESKARGEEAVMNGCSKYFLIRISWLFGPGRKNFVDTMLDLSESKSELSVVNDQFGKPTYTVDVADRLTDFLFSEDY